VKDYDALKPKEESTPFSAFYFCLDSIFSYIFAHCQQGRHHREE
jgi:hypothetical protein